MFSIQLIERINSDSKTIEEIDPPLGWIEVFHSAKSELRLVGTILKRLGDFFPSKQNLFRAFDLCPLSEVKVVIFGQDPYHSTHDGYPQANGMCFSTNRGCPIQPSLANIYKELQQEYPEFIPPSHGDLSNWANQGVLLLNTCLTVAPHQPKSHGGIWNGFITRVLTAIGEINSECIYLLWGKPAQEMASQLGERSIKLIATHPSPFSAHQTTRYASAFIGCGHFRQTNEFLIKQGKTPIDWIHLD